MTLPTGTVTFLFTDIEGSTRQWEAHPEAMGAALRRHDAQMREAIETNGGAIFKTVGDAFCAAFPTAVSALTAALSAQRTLVSEPWPEPIAVRVRMALHTGSAEERDGDYFGPTLNRVARLLSLGYGGQTLLSQITHDLVHDSLSPSAALLDLGLHRLKDLQRPEQVFQLNHPDLPATFPPLKSLGYLPTNLPQQLTSFIGREKEMTRIKELLGKTRLLTLTGSGGTGKTRLSLQAAAEVVDQHPDGVWLVELAPLADPSLVPQTVADVLGVRETAGEPITKTLINALKDKQMLLVLDNCEHLMDASARLADALLKSCPKVRVLASSREALGIAGESVYRVPSLSVPDVKRAQTPQSVSDYESVRLFIERAAAARSDFTVTPQNAPALASVCHRLDGIPLAIELAAARVRAMPVGQIEARLDNCFRLLTGGSRAALPRQQTLKALIDWSYDLLDEQEKALLGRLSVFTDGWSLEAAEAVCKDEAGVGAHPSSFILYPSDVLDLLTSLVDKSLVVYEEREGKARYHLLETVRQYAGERLEERGEAEGVRERHRDYFLALAEEAEPKLMGAELGEWVQYLEEEHENLRTALAWSLKSKDEGGSAVVGLRLCGALHRFWMTRGHLSEGREWCDRALGKSGCEDRTPGRAKALNAAGVLAWMQSDYASARANHEESLAIRSEIGDRSGVASSLLNLGNVAFTQGDYASTRAYYEESLAIRREIGARSGVATPLNNLGNVAWMQGDFVSARAYYEESLAIYREIGDRKGVADALCNLGNVAEDRGDHASARAYQEESLVIQREIGNRKGIADSLNNLGNPAYSQGDYASTRAYQEESLAIYREIGDRKGIADALNNLGNVAFTQGDYAPARAYYEESLAIYREIGGMQGIADSVKAFAGLAAKERQSEQVAVLWGTAQALREEIGASLTPNERDQYDRDVAEVRHALGEEAFAVAWEKGRAMPLEQAIAYALDKSPS